MASFPRLAGTDDPTWDPFKYVVCGECRKVQPKKNRPFTYVDMVDNTRRPICKPCLFANFESGKYNVVQTHK